MQNRNYSTRAIIEAGLIATLIAVITLATAYVPIFSLIGMLVLPIPVTVLYIRHNYKVTVAAVVVSSIIIAIIYNPIDAIKVLLSLATIGITLGYCVKHKKSASTTLLWLTLASAIGVSLTLFIFSYLVNKQGFIEFLNQNIKLMQHYLEVTREMDIKMGVSKEQLVFLDTLSQTYTLDFMLKNIFIILFMGSFMSACLNYAVTRIILKKLKYEMEEIKPFSHFYINSKTAAIVAIFLLVGVVLDRNKMTIGQSITALGYLLVQFMLLLDGLALASHYLKNKLKTSKAVINLILICSFFSQLSILLIYLGFLDILFDFRKIDQNRRPKVE